MVDPFLADGTKNGISANTFSAYTTGELSFFFLGIYSIPTDKHLGLVDIDFHALRFQVHSPTLERFLQFFDAVRCYDQVIRVEELVWASATEILRDGLHNDDKEDRTQHRTLMNTDVDRKLLTVLIVTADD